MTSELRAEKLMDQIGVLIGRCSVKNAIIVALEEQARDTRIACAEACHAVLSYDEHDPPMTFATACMNVALNTN